MKAQALFSSIHSRFVFDKQIKTVKGIVWMPYIMLQASTIMDEAVQKKHMEAEGPNLGMLLQIKGQIFTSIITRSGLCRKDKFQIHHIFTALGVK